MIAKLSRRLLPAVLLLALGFSAGIYLSKGGSASLLNNFGIQSTQQTAHSDLLFEQARAIFSLVSAEYVVKTVFPHEFFSDSCSLEQIMTRLRTSPAAPEELLTPQELECFELYNLLADLGMSSDPDSTDFLVFTFILSAGYDMGPNFADSVHVYQGPNGPAIDICAPEPQILDIQMEDPTSDQYGYPDISVSPAGVQKIAEFVRGRINHQPYINQLLATADANGKRFLQESLQAAGYVTIRFISQEEFDVR